MLIIWVCFVLQLGLLLMSNQQRGSTRSKQEIKCLEIYKIFSSYYNVVDWVHVNRPTFLQVCPM